jgi:hypothetical protein
VAAGGGPVSQLLRFALGFSTHPVPKTQQRLSSGVDFIYLFKLSLINLSL